jgi:uroporphyrinogen-III synthase
VGIRGTRLRPIYLISKTPSDELMDDVTHIPILSIHFLTPDINFNLYSGIIVTSKQAAQALKYYTPDWNRLKVVCVGESTAKVMQELGAHHIELADGYGMGILEVLLLQKGKWLYLRPKMIASSWPARAHKLGIEVDEVIIYETTCNEDIQELEIEKNGVLIFTSPSSIKCFCEITDILPTHDVVVIGTTTQKALPLGIKSILSGDTSIDSCVQKAREIAAC